MDGYTESIWKRGRNLERRRWTLKAEGSDAIAAEENETAANVADRFLFSFQDVDDAKKALIYNMVESNGIDGGLDIFINASFKSYDAAFRSNLHSELVSRGILDILSDIVSSSASVPTTTTAGTSTAVAEPLDTADIGSTNANANASVTSPNGSATAAITAKMRYIAYELGFGTDSFAQYFVSAPMKVHTETSCERFRRTGRLPQEAENIAAIQAREPFVCHSILTYMQNRTCFIDDAVLLFSERMCGEPHNIVMLGAGYDMRFHRLQFDGSASKFEVDTPSTFAAKRRQLVAAGVNDLDDVVYTECDFTSQSWIDVLKRDGLKTDRATFIVWEGVSYYMPESIVRSTLASVANEFEGPAVIAFDYYSPRYLAMVFEATKAIGEPLLFGAEPDHMLEIVEGQGLCAIERLTNSDAAVRYMPVREGGKTLGIAGDHEFFMIAANTKFQ